MKAAHHNTVILAVAESDSHVVANRIIERYLKMNGYQVINLGATTPISEMIDAANGNPSTIAIAVGSLNGHALQDIQPLRQLKSKLMNKDIKIVVGGNIYTDINNAADNERTLKSYGVDEIITHYRSLIDYLNAILQPISTEATCALAAS